MKSGLAQVPVRWGDIALARGAMPDVVLGSRAWKHVSTSTCPKMWGDPRLLVADEDQTSSLPIGRENSPFHRKVFFRLPASS